MENGPGCEGRPRRVGSVPFFKDCAEARHLRPYAFLRKSGKSKKQGIRRVVPINCNIGKMRMEGEGGINERKLGVKARNGTRSGVARSPAKRASHFPSSPHCVRVPPSSLGGVTADLIQPRNRGRGGWQDRRMSRTSTLVPCGLGDGGRGLGQGCPSERHAGGGPRIEQAKSRPLGQAAARLELEGPVLGAKYWARSRKARTAEGAAAIFLTTNLSLTRVPFSRGKSVRSGWLSGARSPVFPPKAPPGDGGQGKQAIQTNPL